MDYTETEIQKISDKKIKKQKKLSSEIMNLIQKNFSINKLKENERFLDDLTKSLPEVPIDALNGLPNSLPIETLIIQVSHIFMVMLETLERSERERGCSYKSDVQTLMLLETVRASLKILKENIQKFRQYCTRNEIDF